MRCPNCGQENPADARFCFACGKPFDEAPRREERKVITVVFADLVGFTSRAEQMDPEDVRALLAPYHQRLRNELWREKYDMHDAVPTAWLEAGRALADEEFDRALDVYERAGAVVDVAAAQLYAARKLVEAGRRPEAELYLQPALAFYRLVGATLRVRQAEALLAATA